MELPSAAFPLRCSHVSRHPLFTQRQNEAPAPHCHCLCSAGVGGQVPDTLCLNPQVLGGGLPCVTFPKLKTAGPALLGGALRSRSRRSGGERLRCFLDAAAGGKAWGPPASGKEAVMCRQSKWPGFPQADSPGGGLRDCEQSGSAQGPGQPSSHHSDLVLGFWRHQARASVAAHPPSAGPRSRLGLQVLSVHCQGSCG